MTVLLLAASVPPEVVAHADNGMNNIYMLFSMFLLYVFLGGLFISIVSFITIVLHSRFNPDTPENITLFELGSKRKPKIKVKGKRTTWVIDSIEFADVPSEELFASKVDAVIKMAQPDTDSVIVRLSPEDPQSLRGPEEITHLRNVGLHVTVSISRLSTNLSYLTACAANRVYCNSDAIVGCNAPELTPYVARHRRATTPSELSSELVDAHTAFDLSMIDGILSPEDVIKKEKNRPRTRIVIVESKI
jgi:hypothetical protein